MGLILSISDTTQILLFFLDLTQPSRQRVATRKHLQTHNLFEIQSQNHQHNGWGNHTNSPTSTHVPINITNALPYPPATAIVTQCHIALLLVLNIDDFAIFYMALFYHVKFVFLAHACVNVIVIT